MRTLFPLGFFKSCSDLNILWGDFDGFTQRPSSLLGRVSNGDTEMETIPTSFCPESKSRRARATSSSALKSAVRDM